MPRTAAVDRAFTRFCESGDPRALGRVFDSTATELFRVASYVLGDRERARDVVQSAFLLAIEKRAEFDTSQRVMPWLCGIVANLARNEKRRLRPLPDLRVDDVDTDPLAFAERAEFRAALERARAELPEPYRPVLDLHLEHGLSAKEIARVLQRPAGTVRTQIVRGLELLRKRLPRGFAIGLAVALAPGVMCAMRATVVARAAERVGASVVAGAAGSWVTWMGGLAMEKSVRVAVVAVMLLVAVAVGVWVGTTGGDQSTPPRAGIAETATIPQPDPETATERALVAERVEIQAAASLPDAVAALAGGVEVIVTWNDTGAPATCQDVQVVSFAASFREQNPWRALTDAAGRAEFRNIPPGLVSVQCATGAKREVVIAAGEVAIVELGADGSISVEGRVVDAAGSPVGDAEIWLSSEFRFERVRRGNGPGHGQFGTIVMHSDAHGRFDLRGTGLQCVAAFKRGYHPSDALYLGRGRVDQDPVQLTLVLGSGSGELHVVVRDVRGASVEGAHVVAGNEVPHLTGTSERAASTPALRANTDELGACTIDRLPTGALPVSVRASGYAPWRGKATLVAGGVTRVDVELELGAVVAGIVSDHLGRPIEGALLQHGDISSVDGSSTVSDAQGAYRLTELGAGERRIVAWKEGVGELDVTMQLTAGERIEWHPVLSMRPAITGVVLDKKGEPVEGAEVNTWAQTGGESHASAVTDALGRFSLGPLRGDLRYTVRAGISLPGASGQVEIRMSDVRADSEIRLQASGLDEPTARVRGRFVRADGRGFEGVEALMEANGMGGRLLVEKDGSFDSGLVRAGVVRLMLTSGSDTLADLGEHELRDHGVLDLGVVEVPVAGAIVVEPRGGKDLASSGATLYLNGRLLTSRRLAADNLRWDTVPAGDYVLCVRRGGAQPIVATAEFAVASRTTTHVGLEVMTARSVTLAFEMPDGIHAAFELSARDSTGRLGLHVTTDRVQNGARERILLPVGSWTVEVRLPGGGSLSVPVAADADEVAVVLR